MNKADSYKDLALFAVVDRECVVNEMGFRGKKRCLMVEESEYHHGKKILSFFCHSLL